MTVALWIAAALAASGALALVVGRAIRLGQHDTQSWPDPRQPNRAARRDDHYPETDTPEEQR